MEKDFIDILKKVVEKHGTDYFTELKKCKAIVSDYTGADYLNERGLLLRAVEAGVSNAILAVEKDDIDRCMKAMQRKLQEEQFMDSSAAWAVIIVLANILRDVEVKEVITDIKSKLNKYDEALAFYHNEQYDKALPIIKTLVKENHVGALHMLGYFYINGIEVEQDIIKATEFYCKAAEKGYVLSQLLLGISYKTGRGVPKDYNKAIEWLCKAANQGNANANFNLGELYYNGEGVTQDKSKALEFYQKAAEGYQKRINEGDVKAQKQLDQLKKSGKI